MARKTKFVLLSTIFLAVAGSAYFLEKSRIEVRAQGSDGAAFTAFVVESQYAGTQSESQRTENYLEAVRSDGSQAEVWNREWPPQHWTQARIIIDLSKGARITVDPLTQSITTYRIPTGSALPAPAWSRGECVNQPDVQGVTIAGYSVRRVHKDLAGPPGEHSTLDLLESAALSCFPLQSELTNVSSNGSVEGKIVRQTMFVVKGNPDPALFTIPANYTERSPSQVFAEFRTRYPGHEDLPETDRLLDRAYEKSGR